jgi:hypothetical protein
MCKKQNSKFHHNQDLNHNPFLPKVIWNSKLNKCFNPIFAIHWIIEGSVQNEIKECGGKNVRF